MVKVIWDDRINLNSILYNIPTIPTYNIYIMLKVIIIITVINVSLRN